MQPDIRFQGKREVGAVRRMIALVDHQIGFRREGKTLEIVPAAHVVQPVAIEGVRSAHRLQPRLQGARSEEHTSELQSLAYLVCRLLLEKKKNNHVTNI